MVRIRMTQKGDTTLRIITRKLKGQALLWQLTRYTAEKVTHINGDYFIKTFAPKTCSKYYTVFKYILQQNLKKNVKFSLWNSFNFRNFKCHKKVNFEGLLLHLPIASLSYYCSEIDKCWEVNLSSLFLVGGQKHTWMKIPNHAEWRDNAVAHPFTETMISIFNA